MRQHDRDVGGARIGEMDEVGPGRRPERTLTGLVLAFRLRFPVALPRGVVEGTSADALGRISGVRLTPTPPPPGGISGGASACLRGLEHVCSSVLFDSGLPDAPPCRGWCVP